MKRAIERDRKSEFVTMSEREWREITRKRLNERGNRQLERRYT